MTWNEAIENYANYLRFEKNASENTIEAYVSDLQKLQDFAEQNLMNITPITISYGHLQEFLYQVSKINYSERTQARWISSIKGFFSFLLEDELREDNPSALLETPKLGLYLPDTLSLEEIEKTIKTIISETRAESMKDMGKVMGMASKRMAGKADGRTISEIVKKLLA